jgi:conjugal transfer mating pair stabilization protein TraG
MVFIIGFDMAGMKLIGRYLMILLWVQLWWPIMSISNLFIEMSFAHKMDSLNNIFQYNGSPLSALSMLGLTNMQHQAADWIAVGGNLIAAAPALALTVLYGGAYTMVNLAHRLSPQDMIDEKQVAPDLMKNPGVLSMSARMTNDPTAGTRQTGVDAVLGNTTVGSVASAMQTSPHCHNRCPLR